LSISRRAHGKAQAIGWFKGTAARHIGKMRDFQRRFETGTAVKGIKTRRPGCVVCEDGFQIAAYPFSDTPTCGGLGKRKIDQGSEAVRQ
jgi:hypothetical protein